MVNITSVFLFFPRYPKINHTKIEVSPTIHCKYEYFDSTVQRAEDRGQKFYFCRRLSFPVDVKLNLSIISDNTERGILKLTRCSCRKKSEWNGKFISKGTLNTKQNLHLSWSVLLPIVKPAIRRSLSFFLRGRLDSITIQSNHLLGNPRYTPHSQNACLPI